MTFTWPVWLWAFGAVAAAALWALYRPGRRLTEVASLSLWQQALADTDRSARRARRVSGSWLMLLAGAAAAVLALAGPVVRTRGPARYVAVAVRPSAELGGEGGMTALRDVAGGLLQRLSPADRVQLLLPPPLGGASEWLSRDAAQRRIARLPPVWASAADVELPSAADSAQHTYLFTPAGADDAAGPHVTIIAMPPRLPPLTVDAVAAAAGESGGIRLFVAARNQTDRPQRACIAVTERSTSAKVEPLTLTVPPGGRESASVSLAARVPPSPAIRVTVAAGPDAPAWDTAWLVRRQRPKAKVAMIGTDEPLLRRFVRVSPGLTLVAAPGEADLVITNGLAAPAGKPALILDPEGPVDSPPGWWRSRDGLTVVWPSVAEPGDPVMRDVSLRGLAIRYVRPWERGPQASGKALAQVDKKALIVRTDPAADAVAPGPRQIYVAFDLSVENARFDRREVLPIFLAQAVEWLLGDARPVVQYESVTPAQTGRGMSRWGGWKPADGRPAGPDVLPAPGLYADEGGSLHAVTLTGLRAQTPAVPPEKVLAGVRLPAPRPAQRERPLWPWLCAAAMALWIAGWALRTC